MNPALSRHVFCVFAAALVWWGAVPVRAAAPAERAASARPAIAATLDEVLAGKRPLETVRLDVRWARVGMISVYGRGIVIRDRNTQFTVGPACVKRLLVLVRDSKILTAAPPPKPAPRPDMRGREMMGGPAMPIASVGSVQLRIGDLSWGGGETRPGAAWPELRALTVKLMKAAETDLKDGVQAADLADGLGKVADGRLAPEVFAFHVHRVQHRPAHRYLVMLGVQGRAVTARKMNYEAKPVTVDYYRLQLTGKEFRALVGKIVEAGFAAWPRNPKAPLQYCDISSDVLNRRYSVQARQSFRQEEKRFMPLYKEMEALYRRALKEGERGGRN